MAIVSPDEERAMNSKTVLLRSRLQAASLIVTASLTGLFLRASFVESSVNPWMRCSVLVGTIATMIFLIGPRPLSLKQLRWLELLLFIPVGVQFFVMQIEEMAAACYARNAVELAVHQYLATLGFTLLILIYSMFMPNSWQRTLIMVTPAAFGPVLGQFLIRSTMPFAQTVITPWQIVETGLLMLVASSAAVFSTATIATLRQQARRAQQLGQYRLKRQIGRGGMGEVYLAEHQLLKRPCAIKLVHPGQGADPIVLARFEHEVRSTARLSHWNSVEIYDYGHTEDGTFYYVMEYLPGMNLSELVQRFGPLLPARVIHFLRQTCAALQEAHQMGLIHRDLKPANVVASRRGGLYDVAKLLDFGLVIEHSEAVSPESICAGRAGPFSGSPLFMSPEQAAGESRLEPRSDLYSLGAVGYFLLCGRPPFEGTSPWRVMIAHARDPVIPPSFWVTGIPDDLERVILKCLSKNPSERYSSAAMVSQELAACQDATAWTDEDARDWWCRNAPEIDRPMSDVPELRPADQATIPR